MPANAKNATAPAQDGPTEEQRQAAIDALKLVGRVSDLVSEIVAHEAAKGKDPIVISQLELAIFPTVLAGMMSAGNEPGGMDKLGQMEKLLTGWDK